jgi:hypothetical protein
VKLSEMETVLLYTISRRLAERIVSRSLLTPLKALRLGASLIYMSHIATFIMILHCVIQVSLDWSSSGQVL